MGKSNLPLRCHYKNKRIVIEIGAEVLAHATNINPSLYDGENDRGMYKVSNHQVFAKEVADYMNQEDEEGNTLVTKMLDAAILLAIEQGAEGVAEVPQ